MNYSFISSQIMMKNGEKIPSVHKRWFKIHMFCGQACWSEARMRYYEGKVRFITFYFSEFLHFGQPFDHIQQILVFSI
jgi:hypothetical protein